jgi:hypothetical protein
MTTMNNGLIGVLIACAWIQRRRVASRDKSYFLKRVGGTEHASRRTFMTLQASDFADYLIMLAATVLVSTLCYGAMHALNLLAVAMCVALAVAFPLRHGAVWRVPTLIAEPWHALCVVWCKLDNVTPTLPLAAALTLAERSALDTWPDALRWHDADAAFVRYVDSAFLWAFWLVTALRGVIWLAHAHRRAHVFAFLRRSQWRKCLGAEGDAVREHVDLAHAFATGVLCHTLAMAPIFLALHLRAQSVALLPLRIVLDLALYRHFWTREFNRWVIRDHAVAHSSQIAFVYLHAAHHDALPISLMASHDTGMLEGFVRFALGQPEAFLSPALSLFLFTFAVLGDMIFHQYVPGVFPYARAVEQFGHHHAEHHFLSLLPLGSAFERPPDGNASNSVAVDEELTTYKRNNALWQWLMAEFHNNEFTRA